VLGHKPQAFNVMTPSTAPSTASYTPTDIEAAMHALSFSQNLMETTTWIPA